MKTIENKNAIIITGGPGMGKTSIINELLSMGYPCIPESGRAIIQNQLMIGGNKLPWADREGFAAKMFEIAIDDFNTASMNRSYTFFDRGLPDVIGYLILCGLLVPDKIWSVASQYRYHEKVFITPPWPEIYVNDEERKQSFEEAEATYAAMADVYKQLDYDLVNVPKDSIRRRARFIIEKLPKYW